MGHGVSRYILSRRAERHLQHIFEYGIEQFGERQAAAYSTQLTNCFQLLAENPRMGRLSPSIRPGLRRHEHSSHVIIYREEKKRVLIVAVLHKRQMLALKL